LGCGRECGFRCRSSRARPAARRVPSGDRVRPQARPLARDDCARSSDFARRISRSDCRVQRSGGSRGRRRSRARREDATQGSAGGLLPPRAQTSPGQRGLDPTDVEGARRGGKMKPRRHRFRRK
ncbi:unnamed protein product, partial [Hapterophycus canaliculatus]